LIKKPGSLEYFLEEGARWNWFDDQTITACAWIAGISGILFVARSLTYAQPGCRSAGAE